MSSRAVCTAAASLLIAAAFPAIAGAAPAKAVILRRTGEKIEAASILGDDYREVVYKLEGVPDPQRIAARDVREVLLADLGDAYSRGKALRDKREWENAVGQFKLVADKETVPARKQYPLFEIAETYSAWSATDKSRADAAVDAYQKLIQSVPETRFLATARLRIGQCQLTKSDFAKAEEAFTAVENEARDRFGIDVEVQAKYWKAYTVERKGNYGEAQALYASLERTAKKALEGTRAGSSEAQRLAELETQALVKQGECLILAGKLDDAQRHYETMQRSRPELKPGAFNGLGQVLFQKKRYEEARYQFSNVVVRHPGSAEEYQRALFWLGRCYEELAAAGKERLAGSKATDYFKDAIAVDPSTPIAFEARQRVK